jgi:hypothetical protein
MKTVVSALSPRAIYKHISLSILERNPMSATVVKLTQGLGDSRFTREHIPGKNLLSAKFAIRHLLKMGT